MVERTLKQTFKNYVSKISRVDKNIKTRYTDITLYVLRVYFNFG